MAESHQVPKPKKPSIQFHSAWLDIDDTVILSKWDEKENCKVQYINQKLLNALAKYHLAWRPFLCSNFGAEVVEHFYDAVQNNIKHRYISRPQVQQACQDSLGVAPLVTSHLDHAPVAEPCGRLYRELLPFFNAVENNKEYLLHKDLSFLEVKQKYENSWIDMTIEMAAKCGVTLGEFTRAYWSHKSKTSSNPPEIPTENEKKAASLLRHYRCKGKMAEHLFSLMGDQALSVIFFDDLLRNRECVQEIKRPDIVLSTCGIEPQDTQQTYEAALEKHFCQVYIHELKKLYLVFNPLLEEKERFCLDHEEHKQAPVHNLAQLRNWSAQSISAQGMNDRNRIFFFLGILIGEKNFQPEFLSFVTQMISLTSQLFSELTKANVDEYKKCIEALAFPPSPEDFNLRVRCLEIVEVIKPLVGCQVYFHTYKKLCGIFFPSIEDRLYPELAFIDRLEKSNVPQHFDIFKKWNDDQCSLTPMNVAPVLFVTLNSCIREDRFAPELLWVLTELLSHLIDLLENITQANLAKYNESIGDIIVRRSPTPSSCDRYAIPCSFFEAINKVHSQSLQMVEVFQRANHRNH